MKVRFTYESEPNLGFFLTLICPVQHLSHVVSQDVMKQNVPSLTISLGIFCLTSAPDFQESRNEPELLIWLHLSSVRTGKLD